MAYHHVLNLIKSNADLIISNYDVIDNGKVISSSQLPKIDITKIWEAEKLWGEITWNNFKLIAPANLPAYRLIIKKSLLKLNDVRFPCGVLAEDQVFAQRVLSEARTLCFLSTKTYVHQPYQSGLSQRKSHKAFEDLVSNLSKINQEALNVKSVNLKRLLLLSSEFFKLKILVACSNPRILLFSELTWGTKIKSILVIIRNYCMSKIFLAYGKLAHSKKSFFR